MTYVIWSEFVLLIKNHISPNKNKNKKSTLKSMLREIIWSKRMI